MRATELTAEVDFLLFQVPVDDGVEIELRITFFSIQDVSLRIVAPEQFSGGVVGLPHVPTFGMPRFFGYYYAGRITGKCTTYIAELTRDWYAKRQAVVDRLPEIREYLAVGLSKEDVARWIGSDARMCYRYGEVERLINQVMTDRCRDESENI